MTVTSSGGTADPAAVTAARTTNAARTRGARNARATMPGSPEGRRTGTRTARRSPRVAALDADAGERGAHADRPRRGPFVHPHVGRRAGDTRMSGEDRA